jgi:hypothetical protein
MFSVPQAADESPAAAQLGESQHQIVAPLLQRQMDGVVLRLDDAEKPGMDPPSIK